MKKCLTVTVCIVLLLLLCSCGEPEGQNYRYDHIPSGKYDSVIHQGIRIKGGAVFPTLYSYIEGREWQYDKISENDQAYCVFDEETKSIFPLCYNAACTHEVGECFANCFYSSSMYIRYYGVSRDSIFTLSCVDRSELRAEFYTFGGERLESVSLSLDGLVHSDGRKAVEFGLSQGTFSVGNCIYLYVYDHADHYISGDLPETMRFDGWIYRFDIDKREFISVCSFEQPDPYSQLVSFMECSDDKLTFIDHNMAITVDINTGEYSSVDLSAVIEDLVSDNKVEAGTYPLYYLPGINRLYTCYLDESAYGYEYRAFDLATMQSVEYDFIESMRRCDYTNTLPSFYADGEKYLFNSADYVYEISSEKTIKFDGIFDEGRCIIKGRVTQTEKGFIFEYLFLDSEGNEENTIIEKVVNGVVEEYCIPKKFVYLTNEDIADGKIDEPFFYNPETGVFSSEE